MLDVATYSPADGDRRRYETAIARRNTAWSHYQVAVELLRLAVQREAGDEAAGRPPTDLRPFRQNHNEALHDYEAAEYDLQRERVIFRTHGR